MSDSKHKSSFTPSVNPIGCQVDNSLPVCNKFLGVRIRDFSRLLSIDEHLIVCHHRCFSTSAVVADVELGAKAFLVNAICSSDCSALSANTFFHRENSPLSDNAMRCQYKFAIARTSHKNSFSCSTKLHYTRHTRTPPSSSVLSVCIWVVKGVKLYSWWFAICVLLK